VGVGVGCGCVGVGVGVWCGCGRGVSESEYMGGFGCEGVSRCGCRWISVVEVGVGVRM